jgi:predicted branched-subunit amino acid permease
VSEAHELIAAAPSPRATLGRALFARGFLGLLPLSAGAIPAGIAFGVAARAAGLTGYEAQLMSVVVFSAAAQVSAASLLQAGTPTLVLVGTVLALNSQLFLLSLAVGRQVQLSWPRHLVTALFLTDGAYGIAVGAGPLRAPVLLGAGISMFMAWNLGTALGTALGQAVPDPRRLGIDLVAPLTFLAVLVPLVRTRTAALVALVAGVAALLLTRVAPSGVAVLGAGVAGIAVGARRTRGADEAGGGQAQ